MNPKERILSLRLLEKISSNPIYAKQIGLHYEMTSQETCVKKNQSGTANKQKK